LLTSVIRTFFFVLFFFLAQELQMHNINLLNKLSSAFDFETSLAKGLTPQTTTTVQASAVSFHQETQNETMLAPKLTQQSSSNLSLTSSQGKI